MMNDFEQPYPLSEVFTEMEKQMYEDMQEEWYKEIQEEYEMYLKDQNEEKSEQEKCKS